MVGKRMRVPFQQHLWDWCRKRERMVKMQQWWESVVGETLTTVAAALVTWNAVMSL